MLNVRSQKSVKLEGGGALNAYTAEAVLVYDLKMPKWELAAPVFAVRGNFTPKSAKHTFK
jgi:hypothetical protein